MGYIFSLGHMWLENVDKHLKKELKDKKFRKAYESECSKLRKRRNEK